MATRTKKRRSTSSSRRSVSKVDPCTRYARDVCDGKIPAGELIKLACGRHLHDLDHGSERGLYFDEFESDRAYKFFSILKHSKGKWAGTGFTLEPWQHFVIGNIFGWYRNDGTRRFRFAHIEVARKNGKTTLAAGIGLILFLLDGEPGAEVYTVATKQDQARLAHTDAKRMVRDSKDLKQYIKTFRDALTVEKFDARYVPLGADSKTLDGLNIHGAICDELHAWPQRDLWDVIETATGARSQPLILSITTAGTGRENIWWERRELGVKILKGLISADGALAADSVFAAIYTLDDSDDWTKEQNWIKANPSLGVTVQVDELRERCREAIETPGKQNAFKRLRLNVPTQQADLWLDLRRWDLCSQAEPFDVRPAGKWWEELAGRQCCTGIDLSSTTDMTAMAHVFPPISHGEPWKVLLRYWLPCDDIIERCRKDKAPYDLWRDQGFLETTDGPVIEYPVIEERLREDAKQFNIKHIVFDRWLATPLTTRLQADGFPVEGFGQGFASMAAPCRELEGMVAAARFAHGGHPVLRFNVACAACKTDPAGNRKPDKATSTGRIDGLIATIMGLGKAILDPPDLSVYSHRGIVSIGDDSPAASVSERKHESGPDIWGGNWEDPDD